MNALRLSELEQKYATNPQRRRLFAALSEKLAELRRHNIIRVWLFGSYVTDKVEPKDVDVLVNTVSNGVPGGGYAKATKELHILWFHGYLKDADEIVRWADDSERNIAQGFRIAKANIVELILDD